MSPSTEQELEQELVRRVLRGDHGALSDLLDRYQNRLYNVVLRMVGHREDAAEVTQEAMLKIIQHVGGFKGESSIWTWMVRIAMNLSFSHLRKKKRRGTVSLDAGWSGLDGGSMGDDQSRPLRDQLADAREPEPAHRVQQEEQVSLLYEALDRLPGDFRAVLVLRDIDEMGYQQVADVLGLSLGTVKSRLFRARLALRRLMVLGGSAGGCAPVSQPSGPAVN